MTTHRERGVFENCVRSVKPDETLVVGFLTEFPTARRP